MRISPRSSASTRYSVCSPRKILFFTRADVSTSVWRKRPAIRPPRCAPAPAAPPASLPIPAGDRSAAGNPALQHTAAGELDRRAFVIGFDDRRPEKVRFPDESGDVMVRGLIVEFPRPTGLHDTPVEHDADGIAHRERFFLIVGHQDKGNADVALQGLQLDLHFLAQLAVERRQGLVEQQHRRPVDEGAGQGDALLLTAGQLPDSRRRS